MRDVLKPLETCDGAKQLTPQTTEIKVKMEEEVWEDLRSGTDILKRSGC